MLARKGSDLVPVRGVGPFSGKETPGRKKWPFKGNDSMLDCWLSARAVGGTESLEDSPEPTPVR